MDRREELRAIGLSPVLVRLASGDLPHPEFEFRCGPVHRFSMVPEPFRPAGFVPLWECRETVVGCRRGEAGPEFLAWYTDDPAEPELLAVSETGLLFWLFSYLTEDQGWSDEPAARRLLSEAAGAIGFTRLGEVEAFQERGRERGGVACRIPRHSPWVRP